jgi:DNA uptake protein ComE-like DNA-binding protein
MGKRMLRLRFCRGEGENETVRARIQLTLCALAILSFSGVGLAQNQDRDPYKSSKTSTNAPAPEARVDINHATLDELLKVPGLTRGWAERVVRFRPYRTKADLLEKGILSDEVYDRIKDYVIAHREKQ